MNWEINEDHSPHRQFYHFMIELLASWYVAVSYSCEMTLAPPASSATSQLCHQPAGPPASGVTWHLRHQQVVPTASCATSQLRRLSSDTSANHILGQPPPCESPPVPTTNWSNCHLDQVPNSSVYTRVLIRGPALQNQFSSSNVTYFIDAQ